MWSRQGSRRQKQNGKSVWRARPLCPKERLLQGLRRKRVAVIQTARGLALEFRGVCGEVILADSVPAVLRESADTCRRHVLSRPEAVPAVEVEVAGKNLVMIPHGRGHYLLFGSDWPVFAGSWAPLRWNTTGLATVSACIDAMIPLYRSGSSRAW